MGVAESGIVRGLRGALATAELRRLPGDRFYVVDRGTLDVQAGGRAIARLGPGDCFGEISLLRGAPRMATVTAAEPVALYALDRDDFLAVVAGQPRVGQQARRFAAARLGEALTPRAP